MKKNIGKIFMMMVLLVCSCFYITACKIEIGYIRFNLGDSKYSWADNFTEGKDYIKVINPDYYAGAIRDLPGADDIVNPSIEQDKTKFVGWYFDSNFTNKVDSSSEAKAIWDEFFNKDKKTIVFYAKYEVDENMAFATLNLGGNVTLKDSSKYPFISTNKLVTSKLDTELLTLADKLPKFNEMVNSNVLVDKKVFKGWYLDSAFTYALVTCDGHIDYSYPISEATKSYWSNSFTTSDNVTLYAKWEEDASLVALKLNIGNNTRIAANGDYISDNVTIKNIANHGYTQRIGDAYYVIVRSEYTHDNPAVLEEYYISHFLFRIPSAVIPNDAYLANSSNPELVFNGWYLDASFTTLLTNMISWQTGQTDGFMSKDDWKDYTNGKGTVIEIFAKVDQRQ